MSKKRLDAISALLADKITGESFLRRQRWQEELEHERQLAAIRSGNTSSSPSVNVSDRPPLDQLTCEAIDQLLHQVDKRHWPTITAERVRKFYPPDEPVPSPAPQRLLGQIRWYASMLFGTEADQYEQFRKDGRYPAWLSRLADRVQNRVALALQKLDDGDPDALLLAFHGMTLPAVDEELRKMLWEIATQYEQGTAPSQRNAIATSAPVPESSSLAGKQARAYALAGIDLASASPLLRMVMAVPADTTKTVEQPLKSAGKIHLLADQILALRAESNLTTEEIAERIGINPRNVYRHLAGTIPRPRQIKAYEEAFTRILGRPIKLKRQ